MWTRILAIGCMTAQIIHESESEWDGKTKKGRPDLLLKEAPVSQTIKDRGLDVDRTASTEERKEQNGSNNTYEFADMKMPWEEEAEREQKKRSAGAPRRQQMDRGGRRSKNRTAQEEEKVEE